MYISNETSINLSIAKQVSLPWRHEVCVVHSFFPPFYQEVHIKMCVLCILCTKTNVLTNIKNQLTPMKLAVEIGIEKL